MDQIAQVESDEILARRLQEEINGEFQNSEEGEVSVRISMERSSCRFHAYYNDLFT